ncbi:hypothetical protein AHiyo1_43110 [Arthrobacter sp. Hiyo1]|uniref:hypothetical protein n=1 Tax=Arthrobacter sp. Hiyo1 TaxID=1588020 RepID=UPI0006A3C71F|nr:hypothetical protein [Arthrobacter sp. Hiyo1]GAP60730.1 hypothetical protein AHiyo1_43110 [Arthrobacter sp. Hiyo1]
MTHSASSYDAGTQTAGLIAALTHIDGVDFHGIATSIGKPSPNIDPKWSALLRHARTVVAATGWPEELRRTAQTFVDSAGRLVSALDGNDVESSKGPAKEVHVAYHALSDGGWEHLSTIAGTPEGSAAHHHP